MIRLAIFASGGGTTAQYILRQTLPGGVLNELVEVRCLIASRRDIGAIEKFQTSDFTGTIYVCDKRKHTVESYKQAILDILRSEEIDWFGQYGWLPKMPEEVISAFQGINQHPAAVPHFGGKGMYSRAPHKAVINFARNVERQICTVATAQLVAPEYDEGGILAEVPLLVNPNWTAEQLRDQLLPLEWQCQVLALLRIAAFGGATPLSVRSVFELQPGEEELLEAAKAAAITAYPYG